MIICFMLIYVNQIFILIHRSRNGLYFQCYPFCSVQYQNHSLNPYSIHMMFCIKIQETFISWIYTQNFWLLYIFRWTLNFNEHSNSMQLNSIPSQYTLNSLGVPHLQIHRQYICMRSIFWIFWFLKMISFVMLYCFVSIKRPLWMSDQGQGRRTSQPWTKCRPCWWVPKSKCMRLKNFWYISFKFW